MTEPTTRATHEPSSSTASNEERSGAARARRAAEARRRQKASVVFEMPDLAASSDTVSQAEIDFFVEHGFLIKRRMLEQSRLNPVMDRVWDHLLNHVPTKPDSTWRLRRDDPASWVDPQWARMPPHPTSGHHQGRQPLEYMGPIVKMHDIGDQAYLLDLLPNNPTVRHIAQQLLGAALRPCTVTRGVYAVFPASPPADADPTAALSGAGLGPHTDQVCQQLNACAYLEDVAPRNGGFTVYPGSHKQMFQAHEFEANWSPRADFRDFARGVIDTTEPWELVAPRGSVVFWHGRLMHSAGLHVGTDIRWALFTDFTHDLPVLSPDEHRSVGQYEWFKDAKLFREDHPVTPDMWRSWRLAAG